MKLSTMLNWGACFAGVASIGMGTALAGGGGGGSGNCFADWEIECCALSTSVWMDCAGSHCDVNYPPYGTCCVDGILTSNIVVHSRTANPQQDGVDNRYTYSCECHYEDFRCNAVNHVCYSYSTYTIESKASKPAGYPCVGGSDG